MTEPRGKSPHWRQPLRGSWIGLVQTADLLVDHLRHTGVGRTFELRYGYYEEKDRQNPLCKPAVIYPDFVRDPMYTEDGKPFVTLIQDACHRFDGAAARTADSTCAECRHFLRGEEWFGLCGCPENREGKNE